MILGVMLNGYKSYRKATYIPIAENVNDRYTTFIGNNGVGKSAILESLDVFFNGRDWNMHRGANRDEVYIAPVLLIEKNKFDEIFHNPDRFNSTDFKRYKLGVELVSKISDYILYEIDNDITGAVRRDYYIAFRKALEEFSNENEKKDYYIIILSIDFFNKVSFKPFKSNVENKLLDLGYEKNEICYFPSTIKEMIDYYFAYVYIPVEQNVDSILKVEAKQMQMLMNRDVLEEIDKVLYSRIENRKNILTIINDQLNAFMYNINESIQNIDEQYSYNTQAFAKKNLTASDIRDKILEAYFKIRCLRYNGKEISELSSGEQRKALVDIAYAFLLKNERTNKEIILAIDEPETSLNTSKCYSQFERLEKLANTLNNQVIITTHWYGALPISKKGNLYHLSYSDEQLNIKHFSFFDYLAESRTFPDDIEMKSMFDLASSIISYIRCYPYCKWIICEGASDKIYLESLLNCDDIRVLPMGGCRRVIKLYNLIVNSLNDDYIKSEKTKQINILCLIDTDEFNVNVQNIKSKAKTIIIRRLQGEYFYDKDELKYKIKLEDPFCDGKLYTKTEIEDCLESKIYYEAIYNVVQADTEEDISEVFSKYEFNEYVPGSQMEGEYSIILPINRIDIKSKKIIINYLKKGNIKYNVALQYSNLMNTTSNDRCDLYKCIIECFKTDKGVK